MFQVAVLIVHGVVILYHPDDNVYENIVSYIDAVEHLYIIDNSESKNTALLARLEKIEKTSYIDAGANRGIGYALNQGAYLALKNGAGWLLTMDQDSKAVPGMMMEMLACLKSVPDEKVGIVSPFHTDYFDRAAVGGDICIVVTTAMTSGSLLNLNAFQKARPFHEEFFIDSVDLEYCLRLGKMGYGIIQAGKAVLHHNVGSPTRRRIFNRYVFPSNHSPVRRYYMARNRAKVLKMYFRDYPGFCMGEIKSQIAETVKIILFEDRKWQKVRMTCLGLKDFIMGRYGKIPDEYVR
jgi:rhamnosyltransferase